jgi:N-carbamoylputrescine amidase
MVGESKTLRVTVCELSNDPAIIERDWGALVTHVRSESSDLVLLPEMPFHPWVAQTKNADPAIWQAAVEAHDRWMSRLAELAPATVVSSRPVTHQGKRLNEGYVWSAASGYRAVHHKVYLPDEVDFWEASWYQRGAGEFTVVQSGAARLGFLICTELWFSAHARDYARQGIHLLVCPRATPLATVDKWIAGARTAAVVSGAFCLSSNFGGSEPDGIAWAGAGWIIEPEEGAVLGVTSPQEPLLTLEIDLDVADAAKHTYPRYVPDL